jgi:glycosyltransferase involved in cell wall biosynthesis
MLATIAICTLNRAASLARTLESLTVIETPSGVEWEVLVVNNGCTDHTDHVIRAFVGRLPIRCIVEPRRGLSRARNRAVDDVTSQYIIWTDDDVIVHPGWLDAYVAAFRRWPEAAIFGGPTIPAYQAPTTRWVPECEHLLKLPYAIRDFGDVPIRLSVRQAHYCVGANCSVRTAEQRKFRYNTDLGMAPGQQRLGEETDVFGRIMARGAIGYWIPDARVQHCIERSRQTTHYIARYFAAHGETTMLFTQPKAVGRFWFGAPRWLWRQLAENWIRYRVQRITSPAPTWIASLQQYGYSRGMLRYWRNLQSH